MTISRNFSNDNLMEVQVIASKRNAIRKGFVYELLNAQDTVLYSYFEQRLGERSDVKKKNMELPQMRYSKGWAILRKACMRTTRRDMSEGLVGNAYLRKVHVGILM
jgi:hypothetical protein